MTSTEPAGLAAVDVEATGAGVKSSAGGSIADVDSPLPMLYIEDHPGGELADDGALTADADLQLEGE